VRSDWRRRSWWLQERGLTSNEQILGFLDVRDMVSSFIVGEWVSGHRTCNQRMQRDQCITGVSGSVCVCVGGGVERVSGQWAVCMRWGGGGGGQKGV
jgi:hypothetical protein